ncbi:hypothetical protein O181_042301 [Austropuccinia psidii MF-1]|uniref:Uncharacterized protein n=1 Tax=Austropuccinia psidii MF-1 TaxID=1389203 RepID=A0A9Q3HF11_9BASI|nr:hypothetical protein [Austropuccinia psidii MF-1]
MVGLRAILFAKVSDLEPGGPSSSRFNTRNSLLPTIDAGWLNTFNRFKTIIGFIDVINLFSGNTLFRKLPQVIKDTSTINYRRQRIRVIRVTNGSQLSTHLQVKIKSQDQATKQIMEKIQFGKSNMAI